MRFPVFLKKMLGIKILGRGGQGIVTLGKILGHLAFVSGYYATSIPRYGAERRGAPVHADVRISLTPIKEKCFLDSGLVTIVLDRLAFTKNEIQDFTCNGGIVILEGGEIPLWDKGIKTICLNILKQDLKEEFQLNKNLVFLGAFLTLFKFSDLGLVIEVIQNHLKSVEEKVLLKIFHETRESVIISESLGNLPLDLNEYVI